MRILLRLGRFTPSLRTFGSRVQAKTVCKPAGRQASRMAAVLATIIIAATAGLAAPAGLVDVKSSLAGVVLEDHLVNVGDQVEDAQPLVYVRTVLTGAVGVAARAPQDGTIREVLVTPGQRIERGTVVIRLQPQ